MNTCFSDIYLLYAKLEEEHGLARHAMEIYNRASEAVEKEEMHLVLNSSHAFKLEYFFFKIYNIYIKKATEFYGVTKTRPIFQSAIERLPEDRSREMSLRFAQVERNLGEIDRARAIYAHCAEICDPRVSAVHILAWKTFRENFYLLTCSGTS